MTIRKPGRAGTGRPGRAPGDGDIAVERFRRRMVAVRRYRGHTQQQFAELIRKHQVVVSNIERGERGVSLGEAVTICAALGVDLGAMVADAPLTIDHQIE